MIYYKYNSTVEHLDAEGAYFMPDDIQFASSLLLERKFSTEVNVINWLRDMYAEKNNDGKPHTFIDIGANVGTYTIILGKVFTHTYSFEPDINTYNILCGNVALHGLSNKTTLYQVPLSDKLETIDYVKLDELGGNNYTLSHNNDDPSHKVDKMYEYVKNKIVEEKSAYPLDIYDFKNVDLIKIDVEGFELNVLKGAQTTLKDNGWPTLLVESWNASENDIDAVADMKIKLRNDLFDYISEMGYRISKVDGTVDLYYCTH